MPDVENHTTTSNEPQIMFTKYSSYLVSDLKHLKGPNGAYLPVQPVMALCRCGKSKHKPYCDGSHSKIGFSGDKDPKRWPDKLRNHAGKDITIHYKLGVCSHDESCVKGLPAVFDRNRKPWINPDGASVGEIISIIEKCPSGALSYTIGSKRYQDLDREPMIEVAENGPLKVVGGILLKDDINSKPECHEHYCLCRCGASKNKPFCDGTHSDIGFSDR
jgi:CDGSH-type Zn-finger protein